MHLEQNGAFQGAGYCRTLIGIPVLQIEQTGQRGRNGNGRNGNEAVTDAASEAFARWLHNRHARLSELPSAGGRA